MITPERKDNMADETDKQLLATIKDQAERATTILSAVDSRDEEMKFFLENNLCDGVLFWETQAQEWIKQPEGRLFIQSRINEFEETIARCLSELKKRGGNNVH